MSFETDQTYFGFKLLKKEFLKELNSESLFFKHEGNGAEVMVLENDDDNKVFSVSLRTPPENDRGVAHILEHSVLCGSKKYPLKEPFIELIKGSLQTFLNAMTFPDKTMYPLASRNHKDFRNLMSVYLDAVFYPHITEETFMQEGWHYELESPDKEMVYKGVVFNEMKGVFSSPESIIDRYLSHSLFPKTTYGYESGGDPVSIPDLTYEEFKEFHRKYYHPSNSRIFFYGDGNTLEYLEYLQENYLKHFDRMEVDSSIKLQRKFSKPKRKVIHYPVAKEESLDKKTFVLTGLKLGKSTDHEHCLAFNILSHLLLGTSASPLRKALIDSELGSEVIGGGFDDQRAETLFAVGLKGTEAEHEEKIMDLIFSTLRGLVENGIEEDMIESAVNSVDFRLREANFGGFAKGIVYNIQALGSWLYDADPNMHLKYDALMKKIKRKSKQGYFEKLIERYLLNNKHQSTLVALPKAGLGKQQDAKVRKKLKTIKSSLKPHEIDQIVERTRSLQELQMTPDSPEALATLPSLGLEDIPKQGEEYPIEIKNESSPKILLHDLFTNKIAYVQVGFNAHTVPMELVQYLPLFGRMILGMGTKKRSYMEMSKRLGIHTGGVRPWHFSSSPVNDRNQVISYIFFSGKAVMEKLDTLFDILTELLGEFSFDDHKRLVEIIRSAKSDMEDGIVPHGNQYVLSRLQSYQSPLGRFDELTDGITYFKFLEQLLERAEKDPSEVADKYRQLAGFLFTKENTLVNITLEGKDYPKAKRQIETLMEVIPEKSNAPAKWELAPVPNDEGFLTASTVQYVGKGANLYDLGFEYKGPFGALKSLLSTSFLWEKVRMQGGAYGSSNSFDYFSGDFGLVSYRDPNLTETLEIYDQIADYLSNLDLPDEELKKLIIGCMGRLDPPLTPDRKGASSMIDHLTGRTHAQKQKFREELLATRLEDIKAYADLFLKIKESGRVCVLGNEEKIKKAKPLFKELVNIFN
ncbi:MAG: peptidase [Nitrospinaceae bacterium]|nr:MAG: peptidase [Nitrospinaceae bacterium]